MKPRLFDRLFDSPRPLTRKSDRRAATGAVLVQSSHGDRETARLNDISPFGCNILCEAEWLRLGGFIAIRPNDKVVVQAIVRWVRDGACGVEFLRPLAHDDFELLCHLA